MEAQHDVMRGGPSLIDRADYADLVEPHRKDLQLHCYRMVGSVLDAEDLVQETMMRAWRSWDSYRGAASIRTWLYRIATNACLDHLRSLPRKLLPQTTGAPARADEPMASPRTDASWLEPYPDQLLPDQTNDPEARYAMHESVSLAFQVLLQRLPPRQRAALILRDVLEWKGPEVAQALGMTESAVNSALYRARLLLRDGAASEPVLRRQLDPDARLLLDRYMRAWHHADVDGLVSLLVEGAILAMPPTPSWFVGQGSISRVLAALAFAEGNRWRLIPTGFNLQPGFVFYRFDPDEHLYRSAGVQVLTLKLSDTDPRVSEITAFMRPELSGSFGFPPTLPV